MTLSLAHNLPAVFGRYILLRRISRGGMGEIYLGKLGEIQGFEKPIIIKKILPDLAQDTDFIQRFIEEAQIAIKLSHGNIVQVYEVGMVDNEYFLALQYVEGQDLRSLINRCRERKERLPPDLCLLIVREIANGLAYAHRKTDETGQHLDLVHCDISPPNILVSWEGEVKIIDFGVAKSAIQRAQKDETIGFGKFGYMAPEQLIRGAVVDRRTDIYSTGVILYELLTGQRLFNFPPGTDYRRVAREVTAGKHIPPSERDLNLSDRFDNLVMRALRTEASERFPSAEEFRDEVQQHLYSMNPTISTDALAEFVQRFFAEEIEENRQMLRSLSQTDMAPFQTELNDASSHTVSYALAGLWTQGQPPAALSDSEAALRALEAGPGPDGEAVAPEREVIYRPNGGTRRLSEAEQVMAAAEVERSNTVFTVLAGQRRRTAMLVAVTIGVLLAGGIALGLALRSGPLGHDQGAQETAEDRPDARPPGAADDGVSVALAKRARHDSGAAAAERDSGVHLTFAPEPVSKSDAKAPPRGKPRKRLKRKKRSRARRRHAARRRRPRAKKKSQEISTAMVQRKFRQVRREYIKFTRSYGRLLDSQWQQILFANTYGEMDENKHRRLNAMLDNLRRKMRAVRQGG
jgi:serine/threonine protein kinase